MALFLVSHHGYHGTVLKVSIFSQVQCKLTQWPESMIIGSGEINDRIHETIYLYTMSVVQPLVSVRSLTINHLQLAKQYNQGTCTSSPCSACVPELCGIQSCIRL